ncbi:serine/threonine protein kinase [Catenulispora acidiphila DSM 44928]|uniref:Serine/threonine protein kinase n=1 Tax=Catenulispora acidiphila (strain DSM 44928 / JCM 14897 / NBRC 102108 / NRRL B-24433 / ID139908) TaxID=479433 RepID=C7QI58_CATAD|nr:class III lanthionine synthetase LanKC [Catenulispora acidiphila]ACU73103.1 serine/threonine protein kinase [Catenulispora acidiphila DSM 44928]
MDDRYEAYTMLDRHFYDAVRGVGPATPGFAAGERELPSGWRRYGQDDWTVVEPTPLELPAQGWKIHASAALDSAEEILAKVYEYCVPRGIAFKFLRSPAALLARVSKYAPRGYSGKFITIYPSDDAACERILTELGEQLDGLPNPYILSDLRWNAGPLHVRYGAFANRYTVSESGSVVPAMAAPDGTLVPDRRTPVFRTPEWVELPEFLAPQLAARNAVTLNDMPYKVERVLHFSNGGGIYVGRDTRTGDEVVLKEGRPHAGLDARGADAVHRVEHEYAMLKRLEGIPGLPHARDLLWVGEHRFLVMDYIDDGVPLSRTMGVRYPLTDHAATDEDRQRYTDWALDIHRQVSETLDAIHERGVVYGDLHMFNVLVRADDSIALLDFEVSCDAVESVRPGLGNPGFSAPATVTGVDRDRYALACLSLALFLPLANMIWLHRPKARDFAAVIAEQFPVPHGFLAEAVTVITGVDDRARPPALNVPVRIEPEPHDWPAMRADLVRSIEASATPERDDRLFPGDIRQFALGGLGLAHGAAGVLYALDVTGAGRFPQYEDWLLRHAKDPGDGARPGLWDGMHGAAFALDHLGHRAEALDIVESCLRDNWEAYASDLAGGLSGIGLNLLHLAERTGENGLAEAGLRAAEIVAERLAAPDTAPTVSGRDGFHAGLMRGHSGQAMLMLRAFDTVGDSRFLDCAAEALQRDLRRCVVRDKQAMHVDEGWRTLPYLDVGSIGIGVALDAYLAVRPDDEDPKFAEAAETIPVAAHSPLYALPGLYSGRAGIILYLAGRTPERHRDPLLAAQVRSLTWHTLPYGGGTAFPGGGLMRLSMDLATGTAGVLLALGAALHDEPVHAPLLAPKTPVPSGAGQPKTGR